jgi:DNA-directed RNA polymerase subunit RPC12/RpoP
MNRRHFLRSVCFALAGSVAFLFSGGCVAPLISPTVSEQKSQAWRCGNCGHLTRSNQDLTDMRCPRCKRKGFLTRITEKELQEYLKQHNAS